MNKIKKIIENENLRYEKCIAEIKEALAHAPEGSLKIHTQRGQIRYFHKTPDGREIYIPMGDESLARILAQKSYNRELLLYLTAMQNAMQCFLKACPDDSIDDIFYALPQQRQDLVTPLFPTRERFTEEWLARPYTPKGFRSDDTTAYYTQRGLRVKSKSELLIAELLDNLKIPYKYECPLILSGIKIHPDFTILDVYKRCEVYLEHGGMLGKESYAAEYIKRITLYEENGIYPGERLILTFESADQPLDTRNLQALIRSRFLPM